MQGISYIAIESKLILKLKRTFKYSFTDFDFRGQDVTAASLRLKLSDDTRHIKPKMVQALIYEAVNVSDKIQPSVLLRPFSAILENVDFSPPKHFSPLLLLT